MPRVFRFAVRRAIVLAMASWACAASGAPGAAAGPAPSRQAYLYDFQGLVRAEPPAVIDRTDPAPDRRQFLEQLSGAAVAPASVAPTPVTVPSEPLPTHNVVVTSRPKKKKEGKKSSFVPPGFEELLEPQTTLVDVYFGRAFLLSTTATFTPNYITFLTPGDVVGSIPDILAPDIVAAALATEMPTNSEFACIKSNQTQCGELATESVDVIFDEGRFRVDLMIAPALLSVRPASLAKFLPRSTAGASLLNVAAASVNGQQGGDTNYNIGNSTTLAYKESRLFAVSNITASESFTVDTLALQRELNGQQLQAGFFRSNAGNLVFIRQADFAGFSIASSLDTRKDLDQSSGNDLQVFLDTRSRVDILKDGRLVSTAVYETGNQIVDTSQLPGGAYEITLRIRDNFGREREETRFYIKTNRLPPKDQTLYFVDVGELVARSSGSTLPTRTNQSIARAGIAKRLTDNFGGEAGFLASEDTYLLEAGIFQLGRSYDVRLSYAMSDDDSRGISLNGRLRLGHAILSSNARKVWSDLPKSVIGASVTQASVNLSVPIGRAALNVTSRYNQRDSGTDRNIGMRFDFPSYRFGNQLLETSLQLNRDNDDLLFLFGVRLGQRSGRWQNQLASRVFYDRPEGIPAETGAINALTSNWQDGDRFLSDVNLTLRAVDERSDQSLETELDIASSLGRTNLEAIYSAETGRFSYGANFATSMIANSESFSFGGQNQAQSAVVLDIEGDTEDAYFDVLVNGSPRGNAQIGTTTLIGLAPYNTYEVSLLPRGNSLVDFTSRARTATLYPGNVVTLSWEVTRVLVAFGQIVDTSGDPISNALIEGVLGLATTDDFGLFQAEIDSSTESFNVKTRSMTCTVKLPKYDATQMMVMLDTLICTP